MAAKRAMQEIIHATGTRYDCPIVIMPIKSRKPVNLLALICTCGWLGLIDNEVAWQGILWAGPQKNLPQKAAGKRIRTSSFLR